MCRTHSKTHCLLRRNYSRLTFSKHIKYEQVIKAFTLWKLLSINGRNAYNTFGSSYFHYIYFTHTHIYHIYIYINIYLYIFKLISSYIYNFFETLHRVNFTCYIIIIHIHTNTYTHIHIGMYRSTIMIHPCRFHRV